MPCNMAYSWNSWNLNQWVKVLGLPQVLYFFCLFVSFERKHEHTRIKSTYLYCNLGLITWQSIYMRRISPPGIISLTLLKKVVWKTNKYLALFINIVQNQVYTKAWYYFTFFLMPLAEFCKHPSLNKLLNRYIWRP